MIFWIVAMAVTAVVAVALFWPLVRAGRAPTGSEENPDILVYRDQLAEVDNDLARGNLTKAVATQTRTEIARRLLGADKDASDGGPLVAGPGLAGQIAVGVLIVALAGSSILIYQRIGAAGAPDLPLAERRAVMARQQANRPSQVQIETQTGDFTEMESQSDPGYRDLVARLRIAAKQRPDDIKGHELLAEHEARLGHFAAANKAQARVIELKGSAAIAGDYTDLGELMIIAAGGYVSPEAENALATAIRLDRADPRARYYSGLDLAQNGRPDLAFELWSGLLDQGPDSAPWIAPIRRQIGDVARMAGIAFTPAPKVAPTPAPGPTQEQIDNSANMTASQRQDMIKTMVARLSTRLNADGGSADEWVRLVRAYAVLGQTEQARAALERAKSAFAGDATARAALDQAAKDAGISE